MCDKASLEQLLRMLNPKGPMQLRPLEALLRVKVANDVPLQSQLVVLRRTNDAAQSLRNGFFLLTSQVWREG